MIIHKEGENAQGDTHNQANYAYQIVISSPFRPIFLCFHHSAPFILILFIFFLILHLLLRNLFCCMAVFRLFPTRE